MSKKELITTTAQWSLVVHRVTDTSAEIWVGTLFPTLKKPAYARVQLTFPDGSTLTRQIVKADWKRPFRRVNQRFYTLCTFQNLKPGTRYTVRFSRRIEAIDNVLPQSWQSSSQWDI